MVGALLALYVLWDMLVVRTETAEALGQDRALQRRRRLGTQAYNIKLEVLERLCRALLVQLLRALQ